MVNSLRIYVTECNFILISFLRIYLNTVIDQYLIKYPFNFEGNLEREESIDICAWFNSNSNSNSNSISCPTIVNFENKKSIYSPPLEEIQKDLRSTSTDSKPDISHVRYQ